MEDYEKQIMLNKFWLWVKDKGYNYGEHEDDWGPWFELFEAGWNARKLWDDINRKD
jgi:hypothetical protein